MITAWTREDIEAILIQLNNQNLPFEKYCFTSLEQGLNELGNGAFAYVYEAKTRKEQKNNYAIKVIGFGDKHIDSLSFWESVEAQKSLGNIENHIVKIYDAVELCVWIEGEHKVVKVEKCDFLEEEISSGNFLRLQFIIMEKVSPILTSNRNGHNLLPNKLADFDEYEILKLAYDIGSALAKAHERKLLHRDVKLENIFYSSKSRQYKLGDFGVAKTTDNGLASTVAFTKGYGAPEVVGTMEDMYDCTVDIYSFGMTLYVLLNELHFPGSSNYRPNVYQYTQGYTPPKPSRGSDYFCKIILKMISFNPDDRYQSMEEVLKALDKLKYGRRLKYQRDHEKTYLAIGTAFAILGAVTWKLSFMTQWKMTLSIWMYFVLFLCVGKGVLKIFKKETLWMSLGIFCFGLYILFTTGFSWWKIILLLYLSVIGNIMTGIIGAGLLVINITSILENSSLNEMVVYDELKWITVLLWSLAVVLLLFQYLLNQRDEKFDTFIFKENRYWKFVLLYFGMKITFFINFTYLSESPYNKFIQNMVGQEMINEIMSYNPLKVGIFGLIFCIIWMGRETILMKFENRV